MGLPFEILFEDNHCLVVNKPAPLPTQAPEGVVSLESYAKDYLREKHHKMGKVYLGIPHRLDRAVCGVIVFARQSKSARRLAEQFRSRTVKKIYWALVEGVVEPESGTWEDWLIKVPEEARAECVQADHPRARFAKLDYRCLWKDNVLSLLEIELVTGRMHQIRVQASSRGRPVRGDVHYGAEQVFGPTPLPDHDYAIALHARSLTFLHPIRYEPVTFVASPGPLWRETLGDTFLDELEASLQ